MSDESKALREADQRFFLSVYRKAVDFYQPRIELRTGVQLGPIDVWEYGQLHQHMVKNHRRTFGFFRALLYRRRLRDYYRSVRNSGIERGGSCVAAYYRNAIYVSFMSDASHEDYVAEVVVHELAHALWEQLGGQTFEQTHASLTAEERKRLKLLTEGCATFSQRVWFRDLYPLEARIDVGYPNWNRETVYERGFEKMREIVNDFGPKVLMEIPRRWREF